ncbi:MAG: hypothetical protein KF878_33015, partial [Planctomycetes bacterium]|nr:hypothetical protein [Planctomycetota bacterium]
MLPAVRLTLAGALALLTLPAPVRAQDLDARLVALTARLSAARSDAGLWHERALLRLELGDRVGALADVSEAVRLDPFAPDPRALRALLLLAADRPAEALADATDGLARGPRADLYLLRARARRALDDLERALADADRALELAPSAAARLERAWIRALRGEWPQVLEDAGDAARAEPRSVEPLLLLGIAHRERGEWEAAAARFGAAL